MASARHGKSTTDDAMAVEMNWQSSGHRDSSDDDGEGADFSPSLHEKERLERKYDDDNVTMTMMVLFPRLSQGDRPSLIHLLLVTTYKIIKQDRGAFTTIRRNMKTESIKRFPAMLGRARRNFRR
jgi:hypothetical protein